MRVERIHPSGKGKPGLGKGFVLIGHYKDTIIFHSES